MRVTLVSPSYLLLAASVFNRCGSMGEISTQKYLTISNQVHKYFLFGGLTVASYIPKVRHNNRVVLDKIE